LCTKWMMLCEVVWLAWLQLPVIFKYRLVTALVPLASDSRILSSGIVPGAVVCLNFPTYSLFRHAKYGMSVVEMLFCG
jgi:hypothetical protein